MDYLLQAACVTDVMVNLRLINRNLTPLLCIGDMTFMDTSEGIKNRLSRYEIKSLRFKMFTLKNAPTDPLFMNESDSAICPFARYLFHIKHILQTWI